MKIFSFFSVLFLCSYSQAVPTFEGSFEGKGVVAQEEIKIDRCKSEADLTDGAFGAQVTIHFRSDCRGFKIDLQRQFFTSFTDSSLTDPATQEVVGTRHRNSLFFEQKSTNLSNGLPEVIRVWVRYTHGSERVWTFTVATLNSDLVTRPPIPIEEENDQMIIFEVDMKQK
ncbi:MAG: hypothetical protein AAF203_00345 [Pseudomonadota bacterium]